MERPSVDPKGNRPVPKTAEKAGQPRPNHEAGTGYSDYNQDDTRKQELRREESEREPWSGSRRERIEFPGDTGKQYKDPVQTGKPSKYY